MKETTPRLSAAHEAAWRNYLRAHALLIRELDAELRREHGLSLVTYDALVQLSEAPDRRLYMKDLADALVYSASGLTRLVDALESNGLARREPDPTNRRATRVTLTDHGLRTLEAAWPTHVAGVQRYFASYCTEPQARTIERVFGAVRAELER